MGGSLPVLKPDKAEIIDLDHLQPLGYRIKDKLDPILCQLDGEVVGQRVPVTVRYLHSLDEIQVSPLLCDENIPLAFCLLLWSRPDRLCHLHSNLSYARNISTVCTNILSISQNTFKVVKKLASAGTWMWVCSAMCTTDH